MFLTGTSGQLKKCINFVHPRIKPTAEIEENKSINLFNLSIPCQKNKHEFSIFYKTSHSMIHRFLNISLSDNNNIKELNITKQLELNNNYNPKVLDKNINKKKYRN